MTGLMDFGQDNKGRRYAIYPTRPVDLPQKTQLLARLVTTACVTSLKISFIGFYLYAVYTYDLGEWVLKDDSAKKECVSETLLFLTPVIPFIFGMVHVSGIYNSCFETQLVDCNMIKLYYIYFLLVPLLSFHELHFFMFLATVFPTAVANFPSCYIPPVSFQLVTFGLCFLFASTIFGFWYYAKNNCQCKKCLGIKEVKLQYETQLMLLDERAKLSQADLTNWFNIASSQNSHLALQLENGEIIHTFTRDSINIQLKPGLYYICVVEMVPVTVCPKPKTSKRICEPAPTPSFHLLSKENGTKKRNETIMNID